MTPVQSPDEDDYKKLHHCMQYLCSTKHIPLTLEADSLHIIKWYLDASYGVHPDCHSHTGGVLMMGKGAINNTSQKQRINTKSSTEAKVVGVDDILPKALWTHYFMEAQGYDIKENTMFQDNMSSIKLEKNGRASSTQRTKHINVRYFFITDHVSKGEFQIAYCPTDEMWANIHTKPLQGCKSIKFRDLIMNYDSSNDAVSQECVEQS
jgi:hypothetical protein